MNAMAVEVMRGWEQFRLMSRSMTLPVRLQRRLWKSCAPKCVKGNELALGNDAFVESAKMAGLNHSCCKGRSRFSIMTTATVHKGRNHESGGCYISSRVEFKKRKPQH